MLRSERTCSRVCAPVCEGLAWGREARGAGLTSSRPVPWNSALNTRRPAYMDSVVCRHSARRRIAAAPKANCECVCERRGIGYRAVVRVDVIPSVQLGAAGLGAVVCNSRREHCLRLQCDTTSKRPPISAIRPRGCTTSITKGKERHNDILSGTGPAGARVFDGAGISSIIGRPVGAPVGLRVLGAVVDGAVDESGSSADGSAEVGAGDGR